VLAVEIETYLAELVAREALGDRLVGAWLFGSGALGDLDPATSDLDVQVVTTVRLPRAELESLVGRVSHSALACPVRGLELVLYAREDLDDAIGPAFQLNLNTGSRMAHHVAYDRSEDPRFWFVLDVAIGREAGRALAGPPPAAVFPEMPASLVLDSLQQALAWFAANDGRGPQAALAAARGPGRGPRRVAGSPKVPRRYGWHIASDGSFTPLAGSSSRPRRWGTPPSWRATACRARLRR
jgi:predicted nucleotidyltransferase